MCGLGGWRCAKKDAVSHNLEIKRSEQKERKKKVRERSREAEMQRKRKEHPS